MIRATDSLVDDPGLGFAGRLGYPEAPAIDVTTRHGGGRDETERDHDGTGR
jgi:hypothetical protein